MRKKLSLTACALLTGTATAADLNVSIEIPRLDVAEYHRPYLAVWIERPDHSVAANLAVWYDDDMAGDEGTKWLKDMRQWWRRSGRGLSMPVDGVSGATRPVGQHQLRFEAGQVPLGELDAGQYELVVEAAREVGGREVVRIPFEWPTTAARQAEASGSTELGKVRLSVRP